MLSALLAMPAAYAGMIAPLGEQGERERLMALLERPEMAQQLEKMGIPAAEARARVAAMSEAEVLALAGKLDAAPAGGALNNQDFLFIIIVILLVLVLL
jgi:hypothetical protein